MKRLSRRRLLAGAGLGFTSMIAGCLEDPGQFTGRSSAETTYTESTDVGLPTADDRLPLEYDREHLRENVASGGVSKDGIPSIDDPVFESVADVGDRIDDGEPVFGVRRNGVVRAYPQHILVTREIVNDEFDGEQVAVTYCPLTGTAMGFERGEVEFGVSGRLLNNNLVMYDRATDSRWPQMLATAIEGPFDGESLEEVPVQWSTWERWRAAYPETEVLTIDTTYIRDYGDDPYGSYDPPTGYYAEDSSPMFEPLTEDDRYPPKRMVLGARPADGPLAVDRESLRTAGVLEIDREGTRYVAVHEPETDGAILYHNPDGIAYSWDDGRVIDGEDTTHEPADLPLERVYAFDAMWFAWVGYYPSTSVHE